MAYDRERPEPKDLILSTHFPKDPSELGFDPQFPLELALKMGTLEELRESFDITDEQWAALHDNPVFIRACNEAVAMVAAEGGTFRAKAKLMAEQLLKRAWALATHEDLGVVPATVQADLIKSVIKMAGLDASIDQKAKVEAARVNALQININLG